MTSNIDIKKKSTKTKRIFWMFDTVNIILVSLITFVILYPLYFCIIASFSDPTKVALGETLLWVKGFTLDAYKYVLNDGSSTNASGAPEYLNTGGTLPIVKEGYKKGFSASIKVDVNTGKIEDLWAYKFVKNAMNIDLKVDTFTSQNRSEYISLLFASNDLPDVIINGNLTPDELMMYGKLEGQIMDIAPYVNETYMPYLSNLYKENPSWKNAIRNM